MNRRNFAGTLAAAGFAAGAPAASAQPQRIPRKNTEMHIGGDYHSVVGGGQADMTTQANLEYNLRHGVKHLTTRAPKTSPDGAWALDDLKRMKDNCDRHGVLFEAIRMDDDYIRLRKGPERDRRLNSIVGNVEKASRVGVEVITYHWRVIPIRRNLLEPGRGGSTYNGFRLEENWRDLPVEEAGVVTADDYWERITYFLERVIPAALQHRVKMACHPYDPPGLPFG